MRDHCEGQLHVTWGGGVEAYDDDHEFVTPCVHRAASSSLMMNLHGCHSFGSLGTSKLSACVDPLEACRDAIRLRAEVLRDKINDNLSAIVCWRRNDDHHGDVDRLLSGDDDHDLPGLPHVQFADGPPLHLQPRWVRDLHSTLASFGAVEQVEEGRILYVNTWCLRGLDRRHTLEIRSWRIDAHYHDWLDDLRLLWDDVLIPGLDWDAFVVRPRPPDAGGLVSPVHVIVVQRPLPGDAAALIPLHWVVPGQPDLDFQAAFLPKSCGRDDVLAIGRVHPNDLHRPCRVRVGLTEIHGNPLPPRAVSHGVCVLVEIYPVGAVRPSDHDGLSLMQVAHIDPAQHVPPLTGNPYEDLRLAVIYRLTFPPRRLYIRVNSYEEMVAHSAALLHVDEMSSPGKLGLFDIEYHEHGAGAFPPGVSRVVRATSHLLARQHVLQVTRSDHYCDRPGMQCIVKRNLQVWPKRDVKLYAIEHAWYFQVIIPPSPLEEDCGLTTSEAVRAAIPVPPLAPAPSEGSGVPASGYSPTTPPSARSRSARGQDEERRDDDSSLMQTCVVLQPPPIDGVDLPGHRVQNESNEWRSPSPDHDPPVDGRTFFQDADDLSPNAFQWISGAWWSDVLRRPQDEPRVATFLTYFLHGTNQVLCEVGRPVSLGDIGIEWFSRLKQTWRDHIDPLYDIDYQLVRQKPPGLREQGFAGAIILIQNPLDGHAAIHISTCVRDQQWQYLALLAPEVQNRYSLILLAQVGPLCFRHTLHMTCTVSIGSSVVTSATQRRVWDGLSIQVVANVYSSALLGSNDDEFTPSAELIPCITGALMDSPEVTDDRFCPLHTWYVHHVHFQRCDAPRMLLLSQDSSEWEQQVRALWADKMTPHEALSISVIKPEPLHEGSQPDAPHILLSQGNDDGYPRAEVLLSARDEWTWAFAALSTLPCLTWEQIIWYSALMECGLEPGDLDCQIWIGSNQLSFRDSLAPAPGTHIQVVANRRVVASDDERTSLLQTASPLPSSPSAPVDGEDHEATGSWEPSRLDMHDVVVQFEWFDAHFVLPTYDFEVLAAPLLPCSLGWLRLPWYEFAGPSMELHLYFDGSADRDREHAGLGVVCFVLTEQGWFFGGVVSCTLPPGTTSFQSEAKAALVALKMTHDFLKMHSLAFGWAPPVHLHYDNLAVGRQASGDWAARAHPWLGSLQRSIVRLCEFRFGTHLDFHHVFGHQGHPGNEAADAFAAAAADGRPSADWGHFFSMVASKDFVADAEWFWFLFHSLGQGDWHGHVLELPGKPRAVSPCQMDSIICPMKPTGQDGQLHLRMATCNVALARDDHFTACLEVCMPSTLVFPPMGRQSPQTRRHSMEDLDWNRLYDACSVAIPAQMDVHSHALLLQQRLSKAFVRSKKRVAKPLKASMSDSTWQLLLDKRGERKNLAQAQRLQHRTTLKQEEIGLRTLQMHKLIFRDLRALGAEFEPTPFGDLDPVDQIVGDLATLLEGLHPEAVPADADDCRALLFTDLSLTTRDWFHAFVAAGHESGPEEDLADMWLEVLLAGPHELHDWAALQFLDWGADELPAVCADFVDGEAENLADRAFYVVAEALPQFRTLQQKDLLYQRLRHLQATMDAPFPHRGDLGRPRPPTRRALSTTSVPRAFCEQVLWHENLRDLRWIAFPPLQPIPLYKPLTQRPCFLICHLFSGRRRAGDFHDQMHGWADRRGFDVRILSMDTAVSEWYGDLTTGAQSWRQLESLYDKGWVAATLCGPPCETWTEARHNPPPPAAPGCRSPRWPRPLRSMLQAFGLEGLTMKEMKQLDYGTMFVLNMLRMCCSHVGRGGCFIMEHPGPPSLEERASVWSLALTQLLRRHHHCGFHVLSQWRWGALACKPTGFLTVGLPRFWQTMWQHHLPELRRPERVAIGVDQNNQFRTAILKEYPAQLCKALAESIGSQLESDWRAGHVRAWPGGSSTTPSVTDEPLCQWVQEAAAISAQIRANASIGRQAWSVPPQAWHSGLQDPP
eukprot:Skav209415  [mRNA]  locus=scaffold1411:154932:164980:- [translate_table: standard]